MKKKELKQRYSRLSFIAWTQTNKIQELEKEIERLTAEDTRKRGVFLKVKDDKMALSIKCSEMEEEMRRQAMEIAELREANHRFFEAHGESVKLNTAYTELERNFHVVKDTNLKLSMRVTALEEANQQLSNSKDNLSKEFTRYIERANQKLFDKDQVINQKIEAINNAVQKGREEQLKEDNEAFNKLQKTLREALDKAKKAETELTNLRKMMRY